MTAKERLYQLTDRLPEGAFAEAERFLEALAGYGYEHPPRSLAEAPWDGEPETKEERAGVEEAKEEIRQER